MAKTAFDASRFSGWWFNPDDLIIVVDKDDPLYDPRANLAPDDGMIRDIAFRGIIEPVIITRRGNDAVVVNGRRRVKAAREANKRLKEAGRELVKVPCFAKSGEDADLFGVLCASNEHRLDDTPLGRAKKAARLQSMGRSLDEIAITFGKSRAAVEKWLKLLDLPAAVRKEVEAGRVSADAALKLRDMAPEKATETVQKAVAQADAEAAEGKKTHKKKRSKRCAVSRALAGAADADGAGARTARMKSRKQVEARLATPNLPVDYQNALKWTLGYQD